MVQALILEDPVNVQISNRRKLSLLSPFNRLADQKKPLMESKLLEKYRDYILIEMGETSGLGDLLRQKTVSEENCTNTPRVWDMGRVK